MCGVVFSRAADVSGPPRLPAPRASAQGFGVSRPDVKKPTAISRHGLLFTLSLYHRKLAIVGHYEKFFSFSLNNTTDSSLSLTVSQVSLTVLQSKSTVLQTNSTDSSLSSTLLSTALHRTHGITRRPKGTHAPRAFLRRQLATYLKLLETPPQDLRRVF
jgi:hypothetical protein